MDYLDNLIINGINFNPYVTSAISQYLSEGGVFLDIGANHGVFSLLAAKNPNTKVFAFEPSSRELSRLWKNLALNQKNNVSVFSYGLSDVEKSQKLVLGDLQNLGRNSLPEIMEGKTSCDCHFSTLPHLLGENMLRQTRVCKIDVEGQEMMILNSIKGCMHLFKESVFIVEISPRFLSKLGIRAEDVYQFFEQHGFKYQFGNPQGFAQWDEFFYHPSYAAPLNYCETL